MPLNINQLIAELEKHTGNTVDEKANFDVGYQVWIESPSGYKVTVESVELIGDKIWIR